MTNYTDLAPLYDRLTEDVPYDRWVAYYERVFKKFSRTPGLILDLACGTGSIALRFAEKGYETIGADQSCEMLTVAQERAASVNGISPIWICQPMDRLDLYGTVDAAVSCLDSINYITAPKVLEKAFSRICLFLEPGGLFLFDARTAQGLRALDRQTFIREAEGIWCAWESRFYEKTGLCIHEMNLFTEQKDGVWKRSFERHRQRAYSPDMLKEMLTRAGFSRVCAYTPFTFKKPKEDEDRWFYVAQKPLK